MFQSLRDQILCHFPLDGKPISAKRHGHGHINTTWLIQTDTNHRYILQRIGNVFNPRDLMHNVEAVCNFCAKRSSDPHKTLTLIPDNTGSSYYSNSTGNYRIFEYVKNSICLQKPENVDDFYQSALAFGSFQQMLKDFPAEQLCESLPNFHNTPDRYRIFYKTLDEDPLGRSQEAAKEIDIARLQETWAGSLYNMGATGILPTRVIHADTKINNVLFDANTHHALCVIDLDTVMLGLSAYDFGDSIRFGAATAPEDETDLSKITLDLDMFRAYTRGFLESCPDLSEQEIKALPLGALTMTLECGLRFLTDFLDGDHYFATHRDKHNLIRCRAQFKLLQDMKDRWPDMNAIVNEEHANNKNR